MKIWKKTLLLLLSVALSPYAYSQADSPDADTKAEAGAAQLTLDDLRTFTDVFSQIRRNYVEEIDDRTLLNAAINGMLSSLDPHSAYLPAQDLKQLDQSADGHYIGIGVDVGIVDRKIVVRNVIVPSPADSADINPGDIFTAINDKAVKGRNLQDAIDELKGEPGSTVNISILSPDGKKRDVEVVREFVTLPIVNLRLLDREYAYFRVSVFNRNSAPHLREALESIAEDGITLRGLIIDLRDNPGGVLQQAVSMADGFLDEGLIVSTRGRNSVMQMEFSATEGQWLDDIPLIILVDRGTASASEVVAGALQDHGRAEIVGEPTFGKGSVQSVLPLRNGDGIKLTTARYYTPSGRSIQAEGIRPDIIIEPVDPPDSPDDRPREADLDRHLENEMEVVTELSELETAAANDFSVQEALDILKEAGIVKGKFTITQDIPLEEED